LANFFLGEEGCKGLGRSAVGYWGRSVYTTIAQEQEFARQRALLSDMILGTGIRVSLWRGVKSGQVCGCYKATNKASDRKCKACNGVIDGYVPGYLKFGFDTLWLSAVDTDAVLSDVLLTTDFKSSKIELVETATTGYIESGDKSFTRSAIGSVWEYNVASVIQEPLYASLTTEYSLDSGSTWNPIAQLVTDNPSTGSIRFRITLTRDDTDVLSPMFEIIRARYATLNVEAERVDGTAGWGPWIRILNSKPFKSYTKSEYGDLPNYGELTFWTTGLGLFDESIEKGSSEELFDVSPNVMFEILDGASAGTRYVLYSIQHSDPAGYVVVTQTFKLRLVDNDDPLTLVW
jgi:hypothetical protein